MTEGFNIELEKTKQQEETFHKYLECQELPPDCEDDAVPIKGKSTDSHK